MNFSALPSVNYLRIARRLYASSPKVVAKARAVMPSVQPNPLAIARELVCTETTSPWPMPRPTSTVRRLKATGRRHETQQMVRHLTSQIPAWSL